LVEQVEGGELDSPDTRAILEEALSPMLAANVDTIVLGCTHYPFVIPLIQSITGPGVRTIDPAPAIARQTRRLLTERNQLNPEESPGKMQFFTSGEPSTLRPLLLHLLGETGPIIQVAWTHLKLEKVPLA
jgi:glutamate racemase